MGRGRKEGECRKIHNSVKTIKKRGGRGAERKTSVSSPDMNDPQKDARKKEDGKDDSRECLKDLQACLYEPNQNVSQNKYRNNKLNQVLQTCGLLTLQF